MKKLLICCIFGATATALAKKMQAIATTRGYYLQISAVGFENFASVAPAFDFFLVAPHIQYKREELAAAIPDANAMAIIDSQAYASLDAEKVLSFAMTRMPQLTD